MLPRGTGGQGKRSIAALETFRFCLASSGG